MSNLTLEKLKETITLFGRPREALFGIPVFEHPLCAPQPKFQLSEAVMVTPEFRAEFNQWAIEFFGYREPERAFIINSSFMQGLVLAPGRLHSLFGAGS